MGDIFLIKDYSGDFRPATDEDREKTKGIKPGEAIKVKYARPRNYHNHKRFFAMLNLTAHNLPEDFKDKYTNIDYLRYEVLIGIGHCEVRQSIGGTVYAIPKSMDFASMDETKFNEIYRLSVNYILKHFLKGTEQHVFENNLNLYL